MYRHESYINLVIQLLARTIPLNETNFQTKFETIPISVVIMQLKHMPKHTVGCDQSKGLVMEDFVP